MNIFEIRSVNLNGKFISVFRRLNILTVLAEHKVSYKSLA